MFGVRYYEGVRYSAFGVGKTIANTERLAPNADSNARPTYVDAHTSEYLSDTDDIEKDYQRVRGRVCVCGCV